MVVIAKAKPEAIHFIQSVRLGLLQASPSQ